MARLDLGSWARVILTEDDGLQALPLLADWLEERDDRRHIPVRNWLTTRHNMAAAAHGVRLSNEERRRVNAQFKAHVSRLSGSCGMLAVGAVLLVAAEHLPSFDRSPPSTPVFGPLLTLPPLRAMVRLSVVSVLGLGPPVDLAEAVSEAAFAHKVGPDVMGPAGHVVYDRLVTAVEMLGQGLSFAAAQALLSATEQTQPNTGAGAAARRLSAYWLTQRLLEHEALLSEWDYEVASS